MSRFLYRQPKGFRDTLDVIRNILLQEGFTSTIQKIKKHIYYKLKGIDFDFQSLDNLTIKGKNHTHATLCGSSNETTVKDIFDNLVELDSTILEGTFVDIGSGKGKLIIYAKEYGFHQTVGVEFAKELYQITRNNIKALKVQNVHVLHQDATEYILPSNTRVIYFLNPFDEVIFHTILPKFIEQMQRFNHPIYLVYRVPIYQEVFKAYRALKKIKSLNFRGDLSQIYLFDNHQSAD